MANEKKDGWTYIDDIPLKISSAFMPPPHVQIPFAPTSNEITFEKYDFSFERKVIEDLKLKENLRKSALCVDKPIRDSMKPSTIPLQSEILMPRSPKSADPTTSDCERNSAKINLSDFENDTSSPFDYMELQTINDLEELSSVFQGLGQDAVEANGSVSFAKSVSSSKLENSENCSGAEVLQSKSTPGEGSLVAESALKDVLFLPAAAAKSRSSEDDLSILPSSKSSLRGCRSYSDIHSLSEKFSNLQPSREKPEASRRDLLPKDVSPALDNNCDKPYLPDPYYELPEESRHFVDAVAGMGFSRDQVSRTVKHLGADEKTVIEHLCQIQNLEECGYDSLEAEAALHLHDYNQDQAKQFLDLINKFQDLGFEKNKVKKALIQNKNDEAKTIDALLSS